MSSAFLKEITELQMRIYQNEVIANKLLKLLNQCDEEDIKSKYLQRLCEVLTYYIQDSKTRNQLHDQWKENHNKINQ
jgi:hypothetical protein